MRDTVAEMAAKAHEISLEAGSKMAAAMKDVIGAAAGYSAFAIESARDLVQYMVRRGQMTQDEADKLIREAEAAHVKNPKTLIPKPEIKTEVKKVSTQIFYPDSVPDAPVVISTPTPPTPPAKVPVKAVPAAAPPVVAKAATPVPPKAVVPPAPKAALPVAAKVATPVPKPVAPAAPKAAAPATAKAAPTAAPPAAPKPAPAAKAVAKKATPSPTIPVPAKTAAKKAPVVAKAPAKKK